ncbi:oxidoreductase [Yinghuangia seranimata]|uniref:oxidoreductase n=1 Tax=Yinghuangia seranimata TaxID=408067 RepID=UPI00248B0365|nr:oxidoreductase [Yinghuangia seranimata]MDI2127012.1 oxidoreductase [Yinghuangia seranimata]
MGTWKNTEDIPPLDGTTAVVTGANSGLGFVVARELARKGATVVLACRDAGRAADALERLTDAVPDAKPHVGTLPLDLADLASVRAFAAAYADAHDGLDLLVNNAGVMALPRRETADGFEMQIGTNHLGHFALTGLLAPLLLNRPGARVVNVSSGLHTIGKPGPGSLRLTGRYSKWSAYGKSKSANLMFTHELARRAAATGVDLLAVSAHPGYASTNLQATGPRMAGNERGEKLMEIGNRFASSADTGALPLLYAATAPDLRPDAFVGPRFMAFGRPGAAPRMPWTTNDAACRELWLASEEATGVVWPAALAD